MGRVARRDLNSTFDRARPKVFANVRLKIRGRCDALMRNRSSILTRMWATTGWKLIRPGSSEDGPCWGADGGRRFFDGLLTGSGCNRNWYSSHTKHGVPPLGVVHGEAGGGGALGDDRALEGVERVEARRRVHAAPRAHAPAAGGPVADSLDEKFAGASAEAVDAKEVEPKSVSGRVV